MAGVSEASSKPSGGSSSSSSSSSGSSKSSSSSSSSNSSSSSSKSSSSTSSKGTSSSSSSKNSGTGSSKSSSSQATAQRQNPKDSSNLSGESKSKSGTQKVPDFKAGFGGESKTQTAPAKSPPEGGAAKGGTTKSSDGERSAQEEAGRQAAASAARGPSTLDRVFEKLGQASPVEKILNAPGQVLAKGLDAVGASKAAEVTRATLGQAGTVTKEGIQKVGQLANQGLTKGTEYAKKGLQFGLEATGKAVGGVLGAPIQGLGKIAELSGFSKTGEALKGTADAIRKGGQETGRALGDFTGGAVAGLGKAAGGLAEGVTTLATQPGKIAQGLYEAAKDPSKLIEGYKQTYKDHGVGGVLGHVGGDLLGGGAAGRALGLGRLVKGSGPSRSGILANTPPKGIAAGADPALRASRAAKIAAESTAPSGSLGSRVSALANRGLNRLTDAMKPYPKDLKTTKMLDHYAKHDAHYGIPYFNAAQQKAHQLSFRGGKIYDAQGRLFDTSRAAANNVGTPRATFTVNPNGQFSAINGGGGFKGIHHSTLSAGAPVAGAGEMRVVQGVLKEIDNGSGHYRPSAEIHKQVMDLLQRNGIDISKVKQAVQ